MSAPQASWCGLATMMQMRLGRFSRMGRVSYFSLVFDAYSAALSRTVHRFLTADTRDSGYKLVLARGLIHMAEDLKDALCQAKAQVVIGPRSAARNEDMVIPSPLPPNLPDLDVRVARVDGFRPDMPIALDPGGAIQSYREILEGSAQAILCTEDQSTVAVQNGSVTYLGAWLDLTGFKRLFKELCDRVDLMTHDLPVGVRIRKQKASGFGLTMRLYNRRFKASLLLRFQSMGKLANHLKPSKRFKSKAFAKRHYLNKVVLMY